MSEMILKASTGIVGSEVSTRLGYTKEDWDKLSEKEQSQVISEATWDLIDVWVEEKP